MNTREWYNKLSRHCEDTPALGSIQYKQIELLAEFIAKVEIDQHSVRADTLSVAAECGDDETIWGADDIGDA